MLSGARHMAVARAAALVLGAAFALKACPGRAQEGQALADLFLRTCVAHIDDVSQLSQLVRADGAERIRSPTDARRSGADGETWLLTTAPRWVVLHFKNGIQNGRDFALCLVREEMDVFDETVDGLARKLALRPVPSKGENSARRASFLIATSPALVEVTASQEPLATFTLISMTKLRETRP